MFHELYAQYQRLMAGAVHTINGNQITISFTVEEWEKFEQEFNLCFVDEDEDVMFKHWQDSLEEE